MNLPLSKKFIILVAVPLIFELGFVSMLGYLQMRTEHLAGKIDHSRQVVVEINSIVVLFYRLVAVSLLDQYNISAAPAPTVQQIDDRLHEHLERLAEVSSKQTKVHRLPGG